jgi:hypothetical protein
VGKLHIPSMPDCPGLDSPPASAGLADTGLVREYTIVTSDTII